MRGLGGFFSFFLKFQGQLFSDFNFLKFPSIYFFSFHLKQVIGCCWFLNLKKKMPKKKIVSKRSKDEEKEEISEEKRSNRRIWTEIKESPKRSKSASPKRKMKSSQEEKGEMSFRFMIISNREFR